MYTTLNGVPSEENQKHIKTKEMVLYLIAVFFYTNMNGMVIEYRRAYLVDILMLSESSLSFFNTFTGVAGFVLSFVYAMILDNKKIKKGNKFKPLGLMAAIPCGLLTILTFYTPGFLKESSTMLLAYLCVVAIIQLAVFWFGGTVDMVAVVMTPNSKEREQLLSFRGISSAVGNSAPLVIVLVMGLIIKAATGEDNVMMNYMMSAILCGVVGAASMLLGMSAIKERITYTNERENPFKGFLDIIKNKHMLVVLSSEFIKNFRKLAVYMQPFIAAVMLGSSTQTLLFALPIGVGTMVGMLLVSRLLKKFDSRTLYIASGFYSIVVNCIAFGVGYIKITNNAMGWLNVVFIFCLFLTGIQFGASNLLPKMFQADILDDLELQTGKRLDGSLPTAIGIGGTVSGIIAEGVAPYVLYGENSIIHYQQGLVDGTVQDERTKVLLLFFYTVVHGIMMLLAGVPFFFYKLTGREKDRVHEAVLAQRAALAQQQEMVGQAENE